MKTMGTAVLVAFALAAGCANRPLWNMDPDAAIEMGAALKRFGNPGYGAPQPSPGYGHDGAERLQQERYRRALEQLQQQQLEQQRRRELEEERRRQELQELQWQLERSQPSMRERYGN